MNPVVQEVSANWLRSKGTDAIPVFRFKSALAKEMRKFTRDRILAHSGSGSVDKIVARGVRMGLSHSLREASSYYIEVCRPGRDLVEKLKDRYDWVNKKLVSSARRRIAFMIELDGGFEMFARPSSDSGRPLSQTGHGTVPNNQLS